MADGPRPTPDGSPEAPVGAIQGGGTIQLARDGTRSIDMGAPRIVPFFGDYPLLAFEDDVDERRCLWGKFDGRAFWDGPGAVRFWPLVRQPRKLAVEARLAVSRLSASWSQPDAPPTLLLRDGLRQTDAWHSRPWRGVPEWLDVELTNAAHPDGRERPLRGRRDGQREPRAGER